MQYDLRKIFDDMASKNILAPELGHMLHEVMIIKNAAPLGAAYATYVPESTFFGGNDEMIVISAQKPDDAGPKSELNSGIISYGDCVISTKKDKGLCVTIYEGAGKPGLTHPLKEFDVAKPVYISIACVPVFLSFLEKVK